MSATRTFPLHLIWLALLEPMLLVPGLVVLMGLVLVVVHLQLQLHLRWLVLRVKVLLVLVLVLVLGLGLVLLTVDHQNCSRFLKALCVFHQLALQTNPPPTSGAT